MVIRNPKAGRTNRIFTPILTLICLALILATLTEKSLAVPCPYFLQGDLNNDCKVNLSDVSIMAANWLIDCNQLPLDPACFDNTYFAQYRQFQSIEVGLELFKAEFGSYPSSTDNQILTFPVELGNDPNAYCGAAKLAEAMVGMDLLGFHPDSTFRSDGLNLIWNGSAFIVGPVYTTTPENLAERVGPFIDLEDAGAFRLDDIYEDTGSFSGSSLVLCDVFEKQRHSGKKTGMPILYFRARTAFMEQDYTNGIEDDIYYYPDNLPILQLGFAENQQIRHPLADGVDDWQDFENMILNPNITVIKRPYRADTFILISAGPDGLYGTSDDVYNFNYSQEVITDLLIRSWLAYETKNQDPKSLGFQE